ncbi:cellulose biosynthesis cyclic di-GMP-binding regulatory protein BcsB [Alteraurantiacibacter aquimixticola]|uniref:Cyclic di-GMP-binding protein n=1 Tax=Alteraurantiacibacter aquimixticola TaxID=2489173 RepID=A0A4T3F5B7_9SPHN|nr:cellulose biosynthesis cyclic di-GMP-binding regulatory protein BcsB [Alteraurantiacibacter aquimixticola]TIX50698.1 hypothetical protein E5222_10640 [Alteraurantiacibacter aquimixticola]
MRIIGIGLLALLLIGTLVVLGQRGAFDDAWQRVTGEEAQEYQDQDRAAADSFDTSGRDVFAAPASVDGPIILSGLPSFANMTFHMPSEQRPVSGALELGFSSRVADGVEGALRVTVNGSRRAEYLLREGSATGELVIGLTAQDLASSVLDIGVSLQGRGVIAECSSDDSIAAVVEIEPATGLRLRLTGEPTSVGDRLALWGGRVPVEWSAGMADGERTSRIHQAAILFGKGYRPLFVESGLAGEELDNLAGQAGTNRLFAFPADAPVVLTSDPANRGVRRFGRRINWRYSYNDGELPEGMVTSALDLRLLASPARGGMDRDLTVTLNDRLLLSRRVPGDMERINQSIVIPAGLHGWDNTLDITLSADDGATQRCGEVAPSSAELLPETVLRLRPAAEGDLGPLLQLRRALSEAGQITLEVDELTAVDAEAAARLLARVGAADWVAAASGGEARVHILSGADVSATVSSGGDATGRQWLVYLEAGSNGTVIARRLDNPPLGQPPALALLVTLPSALAGPQLQTGQSAP